MAAIAGIDNWFDWQPPEVTSQNFLESEPPSGIPESCIEPEPDAWDIRSDEYQWAMIQASPAYFAATVLTGPPEPPYNGRFMVAEHHEEWEQLAISHDRVCVLASRDHSKTFFFDFAIPLWLAVTQPNQIGFIFSATKEQAIRILDDIKTEIETNPKLQWLMPKRGKEKNSFKWSSTQIKLSNGHRIYARGFGTKVRGAHPHYIIVDDGLNDESLYSETVRKKQNDYFYTAITNMVRPGGRIIVVGTPFHSEDLYGTLEKNPQYVFRRYPALNAAEQALWPDRYSKELLLKRKEEIGSIRFAREFLCVPITDEMSIFPLSVFGGDQYQPTVKLGMPLEFWRQAGITSIGIGVDFAISTNVKADYTVVWVMGMDAHGNRWIIDILREQGLPYKDQLNLIVSAGRLYEPGLVLVEANQMQQIFGDELIRTTDLPVKKFVTTAHNKNALDRGVPSLRVLLENEKFRIPRGDARSVMLTDIWINEMRSFTFADGKLQSIGGHDDTVMSCWISDQALRLGGFRFSFGEDVDLPQTEAERQAMDREMRGEPDDKMTEDQAYASLMGYA